jgi:hypothetical protein
MWTIEKYKEIYMRYEARGLSVSDFCMNERIVRSRFYYRLKKYQKNHCQNISCIKNDGRAVEYKSSAQFIPLLIEGELQKSKPVYPVKETGKNPPVDSGVPFIEIIYPNGTTVRLPGEKDMELIKVLINISRQAMFSLNESIRYYLYPHPTDLRKGFYTLSGIVKNLTGQDVCHGDAYIFLNRQPDTMKILHMETGGLVIYPLKPEQGRFRLPDIDNDNETGKNTPQTSWAELVLMAQGLSLWGCGRKKRWKPK